MAKQQNLEMEGLVVEECSNGTFKVEINSDLPPIFCTISGKIRKNFIKIMTGDRVKIEMSPYDLTKGRISQRLITPSQVQSQPSRSKDPKKKRK